MTQLVRMAKDGAFIEVHPTTVQAHVQCGWVEAPAPVQAQADQPEEAAPKRRGRPPKASE